MKTEAQEAVSGLVSWLGQCHPRDYVRWLKETQPEIFGDWPEEDMVRKLEAVLRQAWGSLSRRAA